MTHDMTREPRLVRRPEDGDFARLLTRLAAPTP
jgi:hypothetical protein